MTWRRLAHGAAVAAAVLAAWGCNGAPAPWQKGQVPVLSAVPRSIATPRPTTAVKRSPTAFPTWTAEPVTPTATATATATATPVIYTIQKGDTLLDVANRFGASAAEIQEVNGIADPRSLQIGQQLVIPVGSGDAAYSTPTPTPMPVHPGAVTHNRTTTGDVIVVGEVTNGSASGVEEVTLVIELVNSAGAVVASAETTALSDVIAVKDSAPFAVTIAQAPAYANVRCRVLRALPEVPERAINRDLRVAEVAGRAVYDRTFVINGKVRNTGESLAVDVYVVATLYGRDGMVLGARREAIDGGVQAGGRVLFEVLMVPVGWPVERFEVIVEGRLPVVEPTPAPSPTV